MDKASRPKSMQSFEDEMRVKAMESYNQNIAEEELPEIEYQDEPISEEQGAPTEADIELWKSQFPESKIFRTVLVGQEIIFRTLIRAEYKQIVAKENLNALTREETICATCSLWPEMDAKWIGMSGAGVCGTLAQMIMEFSGFCEPEVVERLV